jgi:hypothetical protein
MRRLWLVPFVAVVLGFAAPAYAAQDGIFVDPDTPAGKEYAIPLDQARQEAVGESSGTRISAGSAQASAGALFGEGIRRVRGAGVRPGASAGPGGAGRANPSRDALAQPAAARLSRQASSGGSDTVATLAIPLGVLLVGGGMALVAGRGRMRRPPSD